MNAGSSEKNESAGTNQTAGTTTIVASSHYITATVSDSDAVWTDAVAVQGVQPSCVQFVQDSADQAICATTNEQISHPPYMMGEDWTVYNIESGQYYSWNTTAAAYNQVPSDLTQGSTAGQLLSQENGAKRIDPDTAHTVTAAQIASPQTATADAGGMAIMFPENTTTDPSSLHDDGCRELSHTTLTSPATVLWLMQNYEAAKGASLPRSTLYSHYLQHCKENELYSVNTASFGKLCRSVFLGLKSRRLGTGRNAKYYYDGIRVIPGSSLNNLSGDGNSAVRQQPSSQKSYKFLSGSGSNGNITLKLENQYVQNTNNSAISNHFNLSPLHPHHHKFLGQSGALSEFLDIEFPPGLALPESCTLGDVNIFRNIYKKHCAAFLDAVVNMEFQRVESLWREFWRSQGNDNGDECEEKYLSKTKLYLLCKCGPIQEFVRRVDYLFYQNIVEVLIPDVLRPIPCLLAQSIRNFANGLESWITGAMTDCPEEITHIKVLAVSALAQTLLRYTSLNYMGQAALAVLQNSSQIDQMLDGINRIDFRSVQEQASWVCQCDDNMVQQLEADFKRTLYQQNSLEPSAAWLKSAVTQILEPYKGKPNFVKAAKQFLLKWSFYSSMIIRDLNLESPASAGSFHLIRLLYDEYMLFLVEHQVALETGEIPIAVMGEKYNKIRPM
jgi:regulatory factor X 1/2/3